MFAHKASSIRWVGSDRQRSIVIRTRNVIVNDRKRSYGRHVFGHRLSYYPRSLPLIKWKLTLMIMILNFWKIPRVYLSLLSVPIKPAMYDHCSGLVYYLVPLNGKWRCLILFFFFSFKYLVRLLKRCNRRPLIEKLKIQYESESEVP